MRAALRRGGSWLWTELTRERRWGRGPRRRAGRSSRAGIALLLTVSIVALLTVVVTEVVYTASVRIKMAANARDEAAAEALAQGALGFYQLFLKLSESMEQNAFGPQIAAMTGMNALDLWQFLPSLSTSLLRLFVVTDGDADEIEAIAAQGGLSADQRAESQERAKTTLRRPFLAFEGDFTASVTAEDSRLWVGDISLDAEGRPNLYSELLIALMARDDDQTFLRSIGIDDPRELVYNLSDWTDADDNRLFSGGRESALYDRLDDPYKVKNAPFDSVEEIRLVDGWHRDAIWNRYGTQLTIYGDGKVNVSTASDQVLRAMLRSAAKVSATDSYLDDVVRLLRTRLNTPLAEGGVLFTHDGGLANWLEEWYAGAFDTDKIKRLSMVHSSVYRVTARGEVGEATVEIEAIIDFSRSKNGKILSYRIR
ncbi:MAG: general secretion pathway protein GspK [Alphaproteobacteria bacterium]|nr:general secretion pathway protein GspK [Alphaproteobacteria bacterium]